MFQILEEPRLYTKLTKFTGSEQKLILDYFYYDLTTEDLIEMILNRVSDREVSDLLGALKDEDSR